MDYEFNSRLTDGKSWCFFDSKEFLFYDFPNPSDQDIDKECVGFILKVNLKTRDTKKRWI